MPFPQFIFQVAGIRTEKFWNPEVSLAFVGPGVTIQYPVLTVRISSGICYTPGRVARSYPKATLDLHQLKQLPEFFMPPFPQWDRISAVASRFLTSLSTAAMLFACTLNGYCQDKAASQTPIAEDLFQFPPETPDKIVEAAIITRNLERQDESRQFIRKLLDLQLSPTELRALRQRVGAGPFLELSGDKKLMPEGRELLLAVNAASKPQPLSSTELQRLIQALETPGEAATEAAVALIANGSDSVPSLLAADPGTPGGKIAAELLQANVREMRHGLITQMQVADSVGQVRILNLLAGTSDPKVAPWLLRWRFDPKVDAEVRAAAASTFEQLSPGDPAGTSSINASELLAQKGAASLSASSERFARIREPVIVDEVMPRDLRSEALAEATRYLTDAVALASSNSRTSSLLLVAKSAAADPSLSVEASIAAGQTVPDLVNALRIALELREANAGIELLRALQSSDFSTQAKETTDAVGSALRSAVNSPDPRIRFLACDVARNVAHTSISSSAVDRTLTAVQNGSLKPEAVVVDSNDTTLRDLDFALEEAGFTVVPCQTGQDGFDAAVAQMSCELILVDAESAGWPIATTLANFRADVRTRNVPIVVIGPERFANRVSRLGEIYPGVWFLAEPVGIESLKPMLDSLLLPPNQLSPEDRMEMKKYLSTTSN